MVRRGDACGYERRYAKHTDGQHEEEKCEKSHVETIFLIRQSSSHLTILMSLSSRALQKALRRLEGRDGEDAQ